MYVVLAGIKGSALNAALKDILVLVAAVGLGKADPVADNKTAAGRKLNRRVEMIVSGDVIGTQLTPGVPAESTPPNPQ